MKYYCIGIKGAGMSTLAQILYDLGNEVQSINEDFFNGAYEEIKAEITGESSSEA